MEVKTCVFVVSVIFANGLLTNTPRADPQVWSGVSACNTKRQPLVRKLEPEAPQMSAVVKETRARPALNWGADLGSRRSTPSEHHSIEGRARPPSDDHCKIDDSHRVIDDLQDEFVNEQEDLCKVSDILVWETEDKDGEEATIMRFRVWETEGDVGKIIIRFHGSNNCTGGTYEVSDPGQSTIPKYTGTWTIDIVDNEGAQAVVSMNVEGVFSEKGGWTLHVSGIDGDSELKLFFNDKDAHPAKVAMTPIIVSQRVEAPQIVDDFESD